jgi:hypothetical protein
MVRCMGLILGILYEALLVWFFINIILLLLEFIYKITNIVKINKPTNKNVKFSIHITPGGHFLGIVLLYILILLNIIVNVVFF